jgi:hypothetical protein
MVVAGWQRELHTTDHQRDLFWEKYKFYQQTRTIYESVLGIMTNSYNNMIEVTEMVSGKNYLAFWLFFHRLRLGFTGLWGILWFGVFNFLEFYAHTLFLCLVLPITIEERLLKI